MKADEAIKAKLKILIDRKLEIIGKMQGTAHSCNCEYCDFEEDVDATEKNEYIQELASIESEILRFKALKLN